MIAGLFLRYFKTYSGYNYVPLTDHDPFVGIVGENGIGKSSILEALDCFFNDKEWNYHFSVKKGTATRPPQIVPIFLFKKDDVPSELEAIASKLDSIAKSIKSEGISSNQKLIREYESHREQLEINMDLAEYYILPIGFDHTGNVSLSVFNQFASNKKSRLAKAELDEAQEDLSKFRPLLDWIKERIEYIYIPREIDAEMFTKLETAEIQGLMGETLHQILSQRVPESKVKEINSELTKFIDSLSEELDSKYCYKTPGMRQLNLRKSDLYNLIIQAFFNNKKLHRKSTNHDEWLEIKRLSSGEKQKAIIDVAHGFLKNHRESAENLIIAIDEPESSLHMSSCYDQFDTLFQISRSCRQLIFSTHWYGFLPIIESGCASVITKSDTSHNVDLVNLSNYREQVKQRTRESKGKLPFDIRLKSTNDFVQSVITSTISDEPHNWLICEGSSEKIYLSHYLSDLISSHKLRIVPVGGASEIKRLYRHLSTCYEDFRNEIKGTIFMLSDTDKELVDYQTYNFPKLFSKRMVSGEAGSGIKLVNIEQNPKSPQTEIEDALNGKAFWETLMEFADSNPVLNQLSDIEPADGCVFESLDLKRTELMVITEFFDSDNNKFDFAKKYVEKVGSGDFEEPNWVDAIRQHFR